MRASIRSFANFSSGDFTLNARLNVLRLELDVVEAQRVGQPREQVLGVDRERRARGVDRQPITQSNR